MTKWLGMMGINMLPKENAMSTQYLEQWMMKMCDQADLACSLAEKGELKDAGDIPMVYQQAKKAADFDMKQADPQLRRLEVASELFDHMCTQFSFMLQATELTSCLAGAREVLGMQAFLKGSPGQRTC